MTEAQISAEIERLVPPVGAVTPWDGLDPVAAGRSYLERLHPGGWAVPRWPREFGGRDATAAEAALIGRALARRARPDLYLYQVALGLAGPLLIEHGTPAQRQRWLPEIASGSTIWCQMFSEPDAGSDLANLSTQARRVGDGWVVDGQKVWTSRAASAQFGLCLARTDPDAPKHQGLTMFVVEMIDPGCTVRPLVQMNGDDHFSEVFLSEVTVPDDCRIGAVGDGWSLGLLVLGLERSGMGQRPTRTGSLTAVPGWIRQADAEGQLGSPDRRHQAAAAYTLEVLARITARRSAADGGSGGKLRSVAALQARAACRMRIAGAWGMLADHDAVYEFLTAPSHAIRGGTNEIQRNILAERVLGLPAEPRLDRDVPWTRSRRGLL